MKFNIRKTEGLEEVEGDKLSFPEYPELQLFIRRREGLTGDVWEITEANTGLLLAGSRGYYQTLGILKDKLIKISVAEVEKIIKEEISLYGGKSNEFLTVDIKSNK